MKFLVIGNLTKDIIKTENGERRTFGGTASYASITASKLGCDTHVLSRGNSELDNWVGILKIHGISIELQDSKKVTCFINDYTDGQRNQYLLSDAGKIDYNRAEKIDVTHIGPVFNEISLECIKRARENSRIVSLDVQGFVRGLEGKRVIDKFWEKRDDFLRYVDLLKLGWNEIRSVSSKADHEEVFHELKDLGVKVVELTFSEEGSIISGKETHKIPAYRTKLVDKTGSGDVFATAFAIKYFKTKDELKSGLFASAAASFVVEDFGTRNIVSRERVEERVKFR